MRFASHGFSGLRRQPRFRKNPFEEGNERKTEKAAAGLTPENQGPEPHQSFPDEKQIEQ